jgi:tetratricopeptide (TPR) repeat protein
MSENELNETQSNSTNVEPSPAARKKFPGWLAGLVLIVLIIVGILGGYASGMGKRYAAQGTLVNGQYLEQYQLGVQAVNAGQYDIAKKHFEYIIQNYPNYPGVKSAYTDLLLRMMITPSVTPSPTPTITPTPDMRSIDQVFSDVTGLLSASSANLCSRNWDDIITKLDTLRKDDITYHAAEVDGMYYMALRNRGVCKIYPQAYEPNASCADLNINLEGGIYDLTQAERFGPLDATASALRTWARTYITGSSFWDQDWTQVLNYFGQVMANYPNLSDSTCTSASERFRQATLGYAQQLLDKGDYCGAEEQFAALFAIDSPKNATAYPTGTEALLVCNGDVNPPKP